MMMSRTQAFTAEQVAQALTDAHGLVSIAAARLGCSDDTIRNYSKRYATVATVLTDAREAMVDLAESKLFESVGLREAWAISLVVKTLGKGRGYVERQEVTGDGGGAVVIDLKWPDAKHQPD